MKKFLLEWPSSTQCYHPGIIFCSKWAKSVKNHHVTNLVLKERGKDSRMRITVRKYLEKFSLKFRRSLSVVEFQLGYIFAILLW